MNTLTVNGQNERNGGRTFGVARFAAVISRVVAVHAGDVQSGISYTHAAHRIQWFVILEPFVSDLRWPPFRLHGDHYVLAFGGRDRVGIRVECRFAWEMCLIIIKCQEFNHICGQRKFHIGRPMGSATVEKS